MTLPIETRLLGYEIRCFSDPAIAQLHDGLRARNFLLRDDIAVPLSVDQTVWPEFGEIPASELTDYTAVADLWESLTSMRLTLATAPSPAWGIAIAVVGPSEIISKHILGWGELNPPVVSPAWVPLGYDVADNWSPYSALCNCGYTAEEYPLWRSRWAASINEFGLFDDLAEALAFAEATNSRVKEHAPFFVYQLLLVDGSLASLRSVKSVKS